MFTQASKGVLAIAIGACLLGGCLDAPSHVEGKDLHAQRLSLYSTKMGIHPNTDVLHDPNNPFLDGPVGEETKWVVLQHANPAAAFYAWATLLAQGPNGERQYYVAKQLELIYTSGAVSGVELPYVRTMAIGAYQAQLDHFPDAVSYDASGKYAFELATLSYEGIVRLGGTVEGGWVLVKTPSGSTVAVKQSEAIPSEEDPS